MGFKEDIKKKPLASVKWQWVVDMMATHLHGEPPEWLFRTRRPLESTSEYALDYRVNNFQPISQQPFSTAVDAIIETASHIYVAETNVDDNTQEFIDDYQIKAGGKVFDLKEYILKYVGRILESDPNAVLVVLPFHPREPFIPDSSFALPNFDNAVNEPVRLEIRLVGSMDIHFVDADELRYMGGMWKYATVEKKDLYEPFYWLLNKETTQLAIPYKTEKGFDYRIVPYYFNDLTVNPWDIVGANESLARIGKEIVSYFQPTYIGAVAIANRMLGIESDSGIVDTRFTYPEKYMQMERCSYPGCTECKDVTSKYAGLYVNYLNNADNPNEPTCQVCNSCKGIGKVAPDTSPLGTHWISKADAFDADGKFQPQTFFVTPPLESPRYLAERSDIGYDRMLDALFLRKQNMTNQSGESKSYDLKEKVTVITNAVKNIYSIYENTLNIVQGFLRGESDIEVLANMPPDLNIKTSQEITLELSEAKDTSSLYTSQLTRQLLLKTFGNTDRNRFLVDFLELNDLLFGMTVDEVLKTIISYPLTDRAKMQVIHDKGFAILKSLSRREGFDEWTEERLSEEFDIQVDRLTPVSNASPLGA